MALESRLSGRLKLDAECGVDIPSRVGGQAQRREALQICGAGGRSATAEGRYSGRGHIDNAPDVEDKRRVRPIRSSALDIEALWCPWWTGEVHQSRSAGEVGDMMERLIACTNFLRVTGR